MSKQLDVEMQPFYDILNTPGEMLSTARGIAFDADQAKVLFITPFPQIPTNILCVDAPVCKWVTNLKDAEKFFNPPTMYLCDECGNLMEGDELSVCTECGDGDVYKTEDTKQLRLKLAHLIAGGK